MKAKMIIWYERKRKYQDNNDNVKNNENDNVMA